MRFIIAKTTLKKKKKSQDLDFGVWILGFRG